MIWFLDPPPVSSLVSAGPWRPWSVCGPLCRGCPGWWLRSSPRTPSWFVPPSSSPSTWTCRPHPAADLTRGRRNAECQLSKKRMVWSISHIFFTFFRWHKNKPAADMAQYQIFIQYQYFQKFCFQNQYQYQNFTNNFFNIKININIKIFPPSISKSISNFFKTQIQYQNQYQYHQNIDIDILGGLNFFTSSDLVPMG